MEGQEPTRPRSREELDRLQEGLLARHAPEHALETRLALRRVVLVVVPMLLVALALFLLYGAV